MEESKNLQRAFSCSDVLNNSINHNFDIVSSTINVKTKAAQQGYFPDTQGFEKEPSNYESSKSIDFSSSNESNNSRSSFNLTSIVNSLVFVNCTESCEDDSKMAKSRSDISKWDIAVNLKNIETLKQALIAAQSSLLQQAEIIRRQSEQIDYLDATIRSSNFISADQPEAMRHNPIATASKLAVSSGESGDANSPGTNKNCISSLGVVNHRDLTRLAAARRKMGAIEISSSSNVECLNSPSLAAKAFSSDRSQNISNFTTENNSALLGLGRFVDTNETALASEVAFPASSYITPTNGDTSHGVSHKQMSFSAPAVMDAEQAFMKLSQTEISPIEYKSCIPQGDDSNGPKLLNSIKTRSDSSEELLTDENTAGLAGPPKGLAARLKMNSTERRKVPTSSRFKRLGNRIDTKTLTAKNNLCHINSQESIMTSNDSNDGSSITTYENDSSNISFGSISRSNSNNTASPLLDDPDVLFSHTAPATLLSQLTAGKMSNSDTNFYHYGNEAIDYSMSLSSKHSHVDSTPVYDIRTELQSNIKESYKPRAQSLGELEKKDQNSNLESHHNVSTADSLINSKSTRQRIQKSTRDKYTFHDTENNFGGIEKEKSAGKQNFIRTTFFWQGKRYFIGETTSSDVYLFIAHDNPRLIFDGETKKSGQIGGDMKGMEVLIETKNDRGLTCFIMASIVANGSFDSVEAVNFSDQRGSAWIVCNKLWAVQSKLEDFPSRLRGEISEIDLQGVSSSSFIDLTECKKVEEFFAECSMKVDIILDPYRTGYWFPYYEGHRKMAPQFRSKGVGYLRLGDDMSQYGAAFLSLNAGQSYLDFGKLAVVKQVDEEKKARIIEEKRAKVLKSRAKKK